MWFNWVEGRQGSGYYKMKLLSPKRFKFDCYLLKYPEGSFIKSHKDPSEKGFEHHRLNILLRDCEEGGNFRCTVNTARGKFLGFKWCKFRPDLYYHSVSKVSKGARWVLSIGWLKEVGDDKTNN